MPLNPQQSPQALRLWRPPRPFLPPRRGTGSSNPSPSSEESANLRSFNAIARLVRYDSEAEVGEELGKTVAQHGFRLTRQISAGELIERPFSEKPTLYFAWTRNGQATSPGHTAAGSRLLPSRDRHQPKAGRNGQPHHVGTEPL
jgi:hypothetical protein